MRTEVLTGTEMNLIPQPDGIEWPEDSLHVVSLDEDGRLMARMSLVALPHIEGTWVTRSLRGTGAALELLDRMEEEVRQLGRTHVFAFAAESNHIVTGQLESSGYTKLPLSVYMKEVQKCQ